MPATQYLGADQVPALEVDTRLKAELETFRVQRLTQSRSKHQSAPQITSIGGIPVKLDEWGVDAAYAGAGAP